jgi:hypothetical protein
MDGFIMTMLGGTGQNQEAFIIDSSAAEYTFGGAAGLTGAKIILKEASGFGGNSISLKAPDSLSANINLTLPSAAGTNGQVLGVDGSGNLSFTDQIDVTGTPSNNQLTVWTDSNTVEGTSSLTFDSVTSTFTINADLEVNDIKIPTSTLSSAVAGNFGLGSRTAKAWTSTFSVTAGDLYYLKEVSGSATWNKALADVASTSTSLLTVATSQGDSREMLLEGLIASSSNLSGGAVGDIVYASASTSGGMTLTAPSGTTGYIVRVIGYLVLPAKNVIYFRPSNDWVELS